MAKKIKLDKKKTMILVGIAVVLILFLIQEKPAAEVRTIQGEWDISEEVEAAGLEQYLIEEEDFDYSTPEVYVAAQEIKARTSNPEEAIKETLRFVVANVRYSSITINYCFNERASTALETGKSDCVGMARLVTALLRAQGIPTRTAGGCLASKRCAPIFAVVPQLEARVVEMVEGDFKKRGFLHEWVEIWTPDKEWQLGEPTSGQLFPIDCVAYKLFAYDTNPRDRCVILDANFWNICKIA